MKQRAWVLCVVLMAVAVSVAGVSAVWGAQPDSCSILSKAEIQAVVNQAVGDGKLSASANPATGAPCEYKVGDYGVFSILKKTAGAGETADKVMAGLKKMNIAVSDASGIGNRSFFSSPGYGMIQLNTFKGSDYVIITMLLPGATEAAQKTAAENLMRTALSK